MRTHFNRLSKPELEFLKDNCNFSDEEILLLNMAARDLSDTQMADRLGVSNSTITKMKKRIKLKIIDFLEFPIIERKESLENLEINLVKQRISSKVRCWYGNSNLGEIFTDQGRSINLFPYRSNQTVRMDRQQPKKWLPFMERHKGVNQAKKVWKIFRWNKCYLVNHLKSVAPVCYLLGTSCRGSFLLWRRC